jgi:hypothetical protein
MRPAKSTSGYSASGRPATVQTAEFKTRVLVIIESNQLDKMGTRSPDIFRRKSDEDAIAPSDGETVADEGSGPIRQSYSRRLLRTLHWLRVLCGGNYEPHSRL